MLLIDFTNIAQSNIPISTAAPTHHVSIFKTLSFSKFSKNNFFKKFLGPFHGPQGRTPPIFEFSFSRYVSPYFFPTFQPLFSLPSSRYYLPSTSRSSQYFPYVQSPCPDEPARILLFSIN